MSIPLTINGAVFEYPVNFDESWGVDATGWAQAVTNGMLQMAGGSFPLTADVNFGPNFGLLSKYFETRSTNPATTGTVRLSSADAGIAWRNNANSGNLILTTNASDALLFNGSPITGGVNPGTQYQLGYYATTGSAISGLTLITASKALASDANGLPVASTTTAAELGFVSGVTSSIQTQLNARVTSVSGTANQITSTGGTTPVLALASPLIPPGNITGVDGSAAAPAYSFSADTNTGLYRVSSDTMNIVTGGISRASFDASSLTLSVPVAMSTNKITGLGNGTATTDATAFGQVQYGFQNAAQTTNTTATVTTSTTYVSTNLSASITPTSSSSRVKITVSGNSLATSANERLVVSLFRGASNLGDATSGFLTLQITTTVGDEAIPGGFTYIDSPSTTSSTTYTVKIKSTGGASVAWNNNGGTDVMILEELR